MNSREALKAMIDGKKVRAKDWRGGLYNYIGANGEISSGNSAEVLPFRWWSSALNTNTFEIYDEPTKTKRVRLAPCLFRDYEGSYRVSAYVFKSEEEARVSCLGYEHTIIKWLGDTHFIDVDVPADDMGDNE